MDKEEQSFLNHVMQAAHREFRSKPVATAGVLFSIVVPLAAGALYAASLLAGVFGGWAGFALLAFAAALTGLNVVLLARARRLRRRAEGVFPALLLAITSTIAMTFSLTFAVGAALGYTVDRLGTSQEKQRAEIAALVNQVRELEQNHRRLAEAFMTGEPVDMESGEFALSSAPSAANAVTGPFPPSLIVAASLYAVGIIATVQLLHAAEFLLSPLLLSALLRESMEDATARERGLDCATDPPHR